MRLCAASRLWHATGSCAHLSLSALSALSLSTLSLSTPRRRILHACTLTGGRAARHFVRASDCRLEPSSCMHE